MPIMDGYDSARAIRLRELGTDTHVPIVALTAHALKGDREACLESGMDDYLRKPIHLPELKAVVDRWTEMVATAPVDPGGLGRSTGNSRPSEHETVSF